MVKLDWKGDPTHISFSSYKILVLFLATIPVLAFVVAIALIPVYVDRKLSTASVGGASVIELRPLYKKLGFKNSQVLVKKRSITYMNVSEMLIIDHSKQVLNDSLKYAKSKSESQLLDCYVNISELNNFDIIWETFVTKVIMNGYFEFENVRDNLKNLVSDRLKKCVPLIRNSLSNLKDISIKEGNFSIAIKVVEKNITEELYEINNENDELYSDLVLMLKNISQQNDDELNADLVLNLKTNLFDKLNFTDDTFEIYADLMLSLNEYNYSKASSFIKRLKSLEILDEDVVSEVLLVLNKKNPKVKQFKAATTIATRLKTKSSNLEKSFLQEISENNYLNVDLILKIDDKNSTINSSNPDDNLNADILVRLKQHNSTSDFINSTNNSNESYADISITIKNQIDILNSTDNASQPEDKLNENELEAEIKFDKVFDVQNELNADLLINKKSTSIKNNLISNQTKELSLDQIKHLDNFFGLRNNLTSNKNETDELESDILILINKSNNSNNATSNLSEEALFADLVFNKKNVTKQNTDSLTDDLDIDLLISNKNVSTQSTKINKKLSLNIKPLSLDTVSNDSDTTLFKPIFKNQSENSLIFELLFTFKNVSNAVKNFNFDRTKELKENQDVNSLIIDLLLMYKNISTKNPTNKSAAELNENEIDADAFIDLKEKLQSKNLSYDELNVDLLLKMVDLTLKNQNETSPSSSVTVLNNEDLKVDLVIKLKENHLLNTTNRNLTIEDTDEIVLELAVKLKENNSSNASQENSTHVDEDDLKMDLLLKLKEIEKNRNNVSHIFVNEELNKDKFSKLNEKKLSSKLENLNDDKFQSDEDLNANILLVLKSFFS